MKEYDENTPTPDEIVAEAIGCDSLSPFYTGPNRSGRDFNDYLQTLKIEESTRPSEMMQ